MAFKNIIDVLYEGLRVRGWGGGDVQGGLNITCDDLALVGISRHNDYPPFY